MHFVGKIFEIDYIAMLGSTSFPKNVDKIKTLNRMQKENYNTREQSWGSKLRK